MYFSKHQLFLCTIFFFLLGITISAFVSVSLFIVYLCFLACLVFAVIFSKSKWIVLFLCLLGLSGGLWRYTLSLPADNEVFVGHFFGQTREISGRIESETTFKKDTFRFVFKSYSPDIQGRFLVFTKKELQGYGRELRLRCEISEPPIFPDFDYKRYLLHQGIHATCYDPGILFVGNQSFSLSGWFIDLKKTFSTIFDQHLPMTQAALAKALVLGEKEDVPAYVQESINVVGLSHVFAISGMHISILSVLLLYLFIFVGLTKQKAFWGIVFLLLLYLILIGFPASAMRASLMAVAVLLAFLVKRKSSLLGGLALSAFIILIINPHELFGIGFQFSYLAVLGIYLYYAFFTKLFCRFPNILGMRDILSVTCAASMLVLPLTVYYFHQLTLITFLSNLLVLPILSLLFSSLFIGMIVGVMSFHLSHFIFYLSFTLFHYLLMIIQWCQQLSWLVFEIHLSLWSVIIFYFFVILGGVYVRYKSLQKKIY